MRWETKKHSGLGVVFISCTNKPWGSSVIIKPKNKPAWKSITEAEQRRHVTSSVLSSKLKVDPEIFGPTMNPACSTASFSSRIVIRLPQAQTWQFLLCGIMRPCAVSSNTMLRSKMSQQNVVLRFNVLIFTFQWLWCCGWLVYGDTDRILTLCLLSRPSLLREQHYQYLKRGLRHLSDAYEVKFVSKWSHKS